MRVYRHSHLPDEHEVYWGNYFTWGPGPLADSAVASVKRAALAIPAEQAGRVLSVEEAAQACLSELPSWSVRLRDWIEVITGDDLNAAHSIPAATTPEYWSSAAWIRSGRSPQGYEYVNPALHVFGSDGRHALRTPDWRAAIRQANRKRDIPELWRLLRDGRAANLRGQHRRAVLDAGTAAELVISTALRAALLRNNPEPLVEKMMDQNWQVARRIELLRSIGLPIPHDIKTKLLNVRNTVAHSEATVTRAQGAGALGVAEELILRYAPLKLSS